MKYIQSEWDTYFKNVLEPAGVTPDSVQYKETRRAFFAGAISLFDKVVTISQDETSEDASVLELENIRQEVVTYIESVRAGKR